MPLWVRRMQRVLLGFPIFFGEKKSDNQLETAVLDSTHTMHQLEVLASSLLVTDLWAVLWTIMFMYLMWENSSLLSKKICSVLDVKSHLSYQHALNQLETAVLDSTHTMHKRLRQDEV